MSARLDIARNAGLSSVADTGAVDTIAGVAGKGRAVNVEITKQPPSNELATGVKQSLR